jgi:hypothetical protein
MSTARSTPNSGAHLPQFADFRGRKRAGLRPTDAAGAARNILKMKGNGLEVGPILMGMGNRAHIVTPSITARGRFAQHSARRGSATSRFLRAGFLSPNRVTVRIA